MRIRICFFPKIREKSADTVRPMAGPGGGGAGTDAGCGLEPAGRWGMGRSSRRRRLRRRLRASRPALRHRGPAPGRAPPRPFPAPRPLLRQKLKLRESPQPRPSRAGFKEGKGLGVSSFLERWQVCGCFTGSPSGAEESIQCSTAAPGPQLTWPAPRLCRV